MQGPVTLLNTVKRLAFSTFRYWRDVMFDLDDLEMTLTDMWSKFYLDTHAVELLSY